MPDLYHQRARANNTSVDEERYKFLKNETTGPLGPEAQQFIRDYEARQQSGGGGQGSVQPPPAITPEAQAALDRLSGGGASTSPSGNQGQSGSMDLYNTDWIIQQQQMALEYKMFEENQAHQLNLNNIQQAHDAQMRAEDRKLQQQLLNKQIDSQQYMQTRDLAQRESEFARNLAFQQEQFRHQQEMDRINAEHQEALLELQRAGEARAERELRANLSANPRDWITYQEYMRQVEDPNFLAQAEQFMGDEFTQGTFEGQTITGQPYPASPGAASDQQIQNVAASFTQPQNGTNPLYNPLMGGEGYAGANVPSPNQMSRAHMLSLSDTEMQMLSGLLSAGINIDGNRVGVNPSDWFQQSQESWIPTFGSIQGQQTQYI